MDRAQWSAKQTQLLDFLCPSFDPGSAHNTRPRAVAILVAGRSEGRKNYEKSGTTALTSDTAAANAVSSTAKWETGSPIKADQHPALSSVSPVELLSVDLVIIPQCVPHLLLTTITTMVSLWTSMHAQLLSINRRMMLMVRGSSVMKRKVGPQ